MYCIEKVKYCVIPFKIFRMYMKLTWLQPGTLYSKAVHYNLLGKCPNVYSAKLKKIRDLEKAGNIVKGIDKVIVMIL